MAMGLIATAVLMTLAGAALIGAGIWRARPNDGPFHGNGPIMVSIGSLVAVDPTTGDVIDRPALQDSTTFGGMAWSPNGDRLAIAGGGTISMFDPMTRTLRSLVFCDYCSVSWMPDGTRLATGRSGEIALIDPYDGHKVDSVPLPGIQVLAVSSEPNGDRFAIVGRAFGRAYDGVHLYVVDRDGSNLRTLDGPYGDSWFGDAIWSPSGDTIAYLRLDPRADSQDKNTPLNDIQIMGVDPDGKTPPRLIVTTGQCFCMGFSPGLGWSPDGLQLAVTSTGSGAGRGLYLVDADGSDLHLILEGAIGAPAWRPVP
jgi:Tol biopolymer transport system component